MNFLPVISGGFDPIHSGHIALIKSAAEKYNHAVVVLLNSDQWLTRKKGRAFMPFNERACVLDAIEHVHSVIEFDDNDNTACKGLEAVKQQFQKHRIVFCNGGDRTQHNIPEHKVTNIDFDFAVGGSHKANSSSWILKQALLTHHETRVWGKFFDLYQAAGYKVKELVIEPNKGISYQRHFCRGEVWFVQSGCGYVKIGQPHNPLINYTTHKLETHSVFRVKPTQWHQLYNTNTEPLVIIEIQYGSQTTEDDIERIEYYKDQA